MIELQIKYNYTYNDNNNNKSNNYKIMKEIYTLVILIYKTTGNKASRKKKNYRI